MGRSRQGDRAGVLVSPRYSGTAPGRQFAHVGQALLDEGLGAVVHLLKIIRSIEEPVAPVIAQPVGPCREGDNYLYPTASGWPVHTKGKGYGRALMEHCLADAGTGENPASACWGRKNRRPGSPTSPSPGSTALRRWMKRAMATPCWPDPSTVPSPLYGPSQGGDHR